MPRFGANSTNYNLPATCVATSATGTYDPPCATAFSVEVTFDVREITQYGESVYVSGSVPELGEWDTSLAVQLSAENYTAEEPMWLGMVTMPVGSRVEYKYFKREPDGSLGWENGDNREFTVPVGCTGKAVQRDDWR